MIRKLLLSALGTAALGAFAGPVVPTTITDGQFAAETKWYTMQIAASGFYLTNIETNGSMPLQQTTAMPTDGDLWCFVGNDASGYTIYNRAEGTAKSLAAPSNPVGSDQGGSAYPTLKAPGVDGQSYLWNFTASSRNNGSYYVYEQGNSSYKLNNRGNRLAFWTAGADAGSEVVFKLQSLSGDLEVNADGSVTVSTDPLIKLTGSVAAKAEADGTISLGNCDYFFTAPEGRVVKSCYIRYADGTARQLDSRGENASQLPVHGPARISSIIARDIATPVASDNGYVVFRYDGTPDFNIVYRIPSIVTVQAGEYKGRLLAINDYRYCGGDIGAGRIDLHMSYSDDNGLTWSMPDDMRNAQGNPVARGTGAATPAGTKQSVTNLDCGFGDPASVSDRETGEILVVACCGRMNFFSSRRDDPQPSARWWSSDGGLTWTEPDYGQWEQIYSLFDDTCTYGYIDGQFVGSGRMIQSSRIKVGSHYRIYCVMSGRNVAASNISNWVLYSDDFGHNWHILGDPKNPAVSANGDEPKCEELPDGSILLAARGNSGGRNFNVFHYTDPVKAEGYWGSCINSNLGTGHGINACNGEIMVLPVRNTSTGEQAYVALQSFPNSTSREKVSLAWKILSSGSDFDEPSDFNVWNGFFQVSGKASCYSTMTWQLNNTIGFLFEECTVGNYGYCEVYRNLTIEEITGGAWEYHPDTDGSVAKKLTDEIVVSRTNDIIGQADNVVGNFNADGQAAVSAAADAYKANPCDETYMAFNAVTGSNEYLIMPRHGGVYSFLSAHGGLSGYPAGNRWLTNNKAASQLITSTTESNATRFALIQPSGSENFVIYNVTDKTYFKNSPSTVETNFAITTDAEQAGEYYFKTGDGKVSIVSATPGNTSFPAIHMNSSGKPVIWSIDVPASKWVMTLLDSESDLPELGSIEEIESADQVAPSAYYDLQGRPVAHPRRGTIVVTDTRRKIKF